MRALTCTYPKISEPQVFCCDRLTHGPPAKLSQNKLKLKNVKINMPNKSCVYSSCRSDSRKDKSILFAKFVSPFDDLERAKKWVGLVGRKDFHHGKITRNIFICQRHFPKSTLDYDYQSNPALEPFKEGTPLDCVQQLQSQDTKQYPKALVSYKRKRSQPKSKIFKLYHGVRDNSSCNVCRIDFKMEESDGDITTVASPLDSFCDICERPEPIEYEHDPHLYPIPNRIRKLPRKQINDSVKVPNKTAIRDFILDSEKRAKFYSGLTKWSHETLWNLLGQAKTQLRIINSKTTSGKMTKMCIESQYLMTLMILRRGYLFTDVALTYKISRITVVNVFKTWLQFLYFKFGDLRDAMFTRKKDLMKPLPSVFQNEKLKDVRVVIDCTEFALESVANFKNQGNIYR